MHVSVCQRDDRSQLPLVGRPKVTKSLPKGLGVDTVSGSTTAIDADKSSPRHTDWAERDRALVLTGLRADELLRANVGDIRTTDAGGVVQVRGKGQKDRRIPVSSR